MTQQGHIPAENRLLAQGALIERAARHLEQTRKLADEWKGLDEAYERGLTELVGSQKMKNARGKHDELLLRLRKSAELFDFSPEGERAAAAYRAQIIEERHELYRSLGFDHRAAIQLRRDFLDRKAAAYEGYLGLGRDQEWVTRSPKGLPITDNPWSHFVPPYAEEWGTSSAWATQGFTSAVHSESRSSGAVNCWSYTRLVGADDDDSGATKAMSEIWVWFRMPAAGMVEVFASLQDVDTNMDGVLRDESGCSDGWVRQTSRAYLWTSGGVERYQTIRDINISSDGASRSWNSSGTAPGQFIYPHLFSSRTYAAGEWVTAAIGVQDDASFHVNDMSVDPSRVTSRYFLKDIWIRSTGAP